MESEFPYLFGNPQADEWKQTPLGLNYNAKGFDRTPQNPKQVKKTAKRLNRALAWMIEENVPQYVQDEFSAYFRDLPTCLPGWLDEAFLWLKETRWAPCLNRYPKLAAIRPGDIRITLEPAPIWVPYWKKHTCGIMEPDKGGAISLCVAAVTRGGDGPELNWLRRVDALAKWEMGNWAAHYVLGLDARVKEYGDQPLC